MQYDKCIRCEVRRMEIRWDPSLTATKLRQSYHTYIHTYILTYTHTYIHYYWCFGHKPLTKLQTTTEAIVPGRCYNIAAECMREIYYQLFETSHWNVKIKIKNFERYTSRTASISSTIHRTYNKCKNIQAKKNGSWVVSRIFIRVYPRLSCQKIYRNAYIVSGIC